MDYSRNQNFQQNNATTRQSKKTTVMEKKDFEYIEQYRKIYRRVIQEEKRK